MNTISAELFETLCDCAANEGVSVRCDYSGRGMYGGRCVGIDGEFRAIQRVLGDVQDRIVMDIEDGDSDAIALLTEWNGFCWSFDMDSMGLGQIVYWPRVQAPENADEILERYFDEEDY